MPRRQLTDRAIRSIPTPKSGNVSVWDSVARGLGVRVSSTGNKTFVVLIASGRRRSIGRYPEVSLAQARDEARRLIAEKVLGTLKTHSVSFPKARDEFLDSCRARLRSRTVADYQRLLGRVSFAKSVADISASDVTRALAAFRTAPSEQNHVFVALRALFRFAVSQQYVSVSPMQGMRLPSKATPRSRVLSPAEICAIWTAADDGPFGAIVKLLFLTGQRRSEIARIEWDHVSDALTIPANNAKNGREHSVPLPESAQQLIDAQPRLSHYVFPARTASVRGVPSTVFNGWAKSKRALDTASGVADWTLHDIRRTVATNLAALGTPIHVTERILNHVSGSQSGIVAVYQRHEYFDEMRAALTAWEQRLHDIVEQ
ncbi:MAG: tyrosine-type recombinase/integrase [Caldilineaceae bacterium]|nr:tyrosine-type recombinase/integrase [Caldilineaceae bacterium]